MANAEHLAILKSGVKAWNEFRETNPSLRINLKNANLYFLSLGSFNLSNVNLRGANMGYADLRYTNLSGANLIFTDLRLANLSGANLREANLSGANFNGANLSKANLHKADLSDSNLSRTKMGEANLSGADLTGARIQKSDLLDTEFTDAIFSYTIISQSDLSTAIGLNTVQVSNQCCIDFQTLKASESLPKSFLLKIGLPEIYIDYLPDFFTDTLTLFPVFLSHSKENREFARKLYEALIAKGVNVFFDEKHLKPGDSLVKTITKGINHYDKTILVCSKESLTSKWVDYELNLVLKKELALMEQKATDDVSLLIPVTIDDQIFSWNGDKEWIKDRYICDFREWQDSAKFEKALNELIHALNIKRPDFKPPSFLGMEDG